VKEDYHRQREAGIEHFLFKTLELIRKPSVKITRTVLNRK